MLRLNCAEYMPWLFQPPGKDVQITELEDGNYKFALSASPRAMRFWILQFGKYVKVLSPQHMVDLIKDDINEMQKLYEE